MRVANCKKCLLFGLKTGFFVLFFVANLTINSNSLLVIIFIHYHCLLTGVTILGKPGWQEISSKILDTGMYAALKGFSPLDSRFKNFTLFDSPSGQNWLLFYGSLHLMRGEQNIYYWVSCVFWVSCGTHCSVYDCY